MPIVPSFKDRYRKPVETRFWIYVDKKGEDECWEWLGSKFGKSAGGYGQLSGKERNLKAHRVSWEIHFGEIPEGDCVLHRCDNPSCVNPNHLFLGSQQDNQADKVSKSRQAKGEQIAHLVKLATKQVLDIRRRYKNRRLKKRDPKDGIRALAVEYKVYDQAIRHIISRKTWKHLEEKN